MQASPHSPPSHQGASVWHRGSGAHRWGCASAGNGRPVGHHLQRAGRLHGVQVPLTLPSRPPRQAQVQVVGEQQLNLLLSHSHVAQCVVGVVLVYRLACSHPSNGTRGRTLTQGLPPKESALPIPRREAEVTLIWKVVLPKESCNYSPFHIDVFDGNIPAVKASFWGVGKDTYHPADLSCAFERLSYLPKKNIS